MKKLLITLLTAASLAACNDNSSNTAMQAAGVKQAPPQKTQATKTDKHKDPSQVWPYIANASTEDITENMTAKNYVIVFDDSGSMHDTCNSKAAKFEEGKEAVTQFINAVPEGVNLALYNMNAGFLVSLTPNHDVVAQALRDSRINGGTPLDTSIKRAYKALTKQGQAQLGYGTYGIIVVTDGAAGMGEDPTNTVNAIVDQTPVEIHTVGFCLGNNHSLNQAGRTFYTAADDVNTLIAAMKSVLAESESFDGDFSSL